MEVLKILFLIIKEQPVLCCYSAVAGQRMLSKVREMGKVGVVESYKFICNVFFPFPCNTAR